MKQPKTRHFRTCLDLTWIWYYCELFTKRHVMSSICDFYVTWHTRPHRDRDVMSYINVMRIWLWKLNLCLLEKKLCKYAFYCINQYINACKSQLWETTKLRTVIVFIFQNVLQELLPKTNARNTLRIMLLIQSNETKNSAKAIGKL